MNILIADDDEVSRYLLEAILLQQGHQVTATIDGWQAWTALERDYFPIVISDWVMPKVDGLALCGELRKTQRDQYSYFVLLTSRGSKTDYLEAMSAGVDDFMTKPVDEEALVARIHVAERILGLRQQISELQGLVPICANCKDIRDELGTWHQLEEYISRHSRANFSHGLCPRCSQKLGFS